jgi:hypothetical protein
MKHLLWIVGVAALIPGVIFLESRVIVAVVFFVISLICLATFFFLMFRGEGNQDISITKF